MLKVVNIPSSNSTKAFVISENEVFAKGTPIKQLKIVPGYGKVVAVTKREVKLVTLNHCAGISRCRYAILVFDRDILAQSSVAATLLLQFLLITYIHIGNKGCSQISCT